MPTVYLTLYLADVPIVKQRKLVIQVKQQQVHPLPS